MDHPEPTLFLAGRHVPAAERETLPLVDPSTGRAFSRVPIATSDDLDEAMGAAAAVFPSWAATPAYERARILGRAAELLRERAEVIGPITTREQGKPVAEATVEARAAAEILDWFGQEARRHYGRVVPSRVPSRRDLVLPKPVGPVAAFTPWNFPITIPARKVGAALAAGCPVVLKPAEETPGTALQLAQALHDAGLPPGCLSIVFGDPATVSEQLIRDPRTRKVTFTGSTAIGRRIAGLAAEGVKRVTLELGGHAPVLVFDDADVERAVRLAAGSKYRNAGQVCISPTRFLVQAAVYDTFRDRFTDAVAALRLGAGLDPDTTMGPLAHDRRVPAVAGLVEDAVGHGGKVLTGGHAPDGDGYFFEPTVVEQVDPAARVMREEPFGPVALLTPFEELEDGLALANALPYGLAAYAFTGSLDTAYAVSEQLESGMVGVNHFAIQGPETPFGGIKDSGYGSEGGSEGLDDFLYSKLVSHA
ncbi:NAD-dependent succinate-semialdehyde dehydrogenase [Nitriliruptoraceae bacterium ZYF776]|nr:NAD-dependent succinate-semialdehyde dehydrogenase [Profundirhabdus halotolerans]